MFSSKLYFTEWQNNVKAPKAPKARFKRCASLVSYQIQLRFDFATTKVRQLFQTMYLMLMYKIKWIQERSESYQSPITRQGLRVPWECRSYSNSNLPYQNVSDAIPFAVLFGAAHERYGVSNGPKPATKPATKRKSLFF